MPSFQSAGQPYILGLNQSGEVADNSAAGNPNSGWTSYPDIVVNDPERAISGNFVDSSPVASDAPTGVYSGASGYEDGDFGDVTDHDGGYNQDAGYDGEDGSYGSFGGGSFGGSFGYGPVVLDLNGNGISITPKSQSSTFYDMAGDGYQHHTAWAGAGDGVLVFDTKGDGKITQQNQVVFTDWDPTAATDMQALLDVFDTNHDGKLDSGDAQFAKFKIMVTNADGTTTLKTLAQAGIASIDLTSDQTRQTFTDGSSIDGETTYTKTDGTTGAAATVTLAFDAAGHAVTTTVTHNGSGSTTIDNVTVDPDGGVAAEIISTTSANGLTRVTVYDDDGDGVTDHTQTDRTVANSDGTRTETSNDVDGAGTLLGAIVTTTSADGKTVTILRDADGNGVTDQKEIDATAADGSKSVTLTDLNPNGSTRNGSVHTASADGQTGTTKSDLNGDGVYDLTTVDQVVTNANGSQTETVTDTSGRSSLRDKTVTTTSADASTQTVQSDRNGDGVFDGTRSSTIVRNADGGTTTTRTDKTARGAVFATLTTTITADGLSTTTQSDINGDGAIDQTRTDATVVAAGGVRTETISDTNVTGALLDRTVIVKATDGVTRTTSVDADGNGKYDSVDQVTQATNGVVTETLSNYQPNGSTLLSKSTTTTSANGLAKTIQTDANGDAKIDDTSSVVTVRNSDGSATVTATDRSGDGKLHRQTVSTTSADGQTVTTSTDVDGDGDYDATSSVAKVVDSSGNQTTTAMTQSANGALESKTVTTLSANHLKTTVLRNLNGDATNEQTEVIAKSSVGDIVDTVKDYSPSKVLVSSRVVTTSANGFSKTVQDDLDGDGVVDQTTSDATVLHTEGSRTETLTDYGPSGVLRDKKIITTDPTGFSVTTQSDDDGDGTVDQTTTDVTTLTDTGSRIRTVTRSAGGTTIDVTTTTVSATGLSTTITTDADGDGTIDTTTAHSVTLKSDGSKQDVVNDKNQDGSLRDQTITTTSADRKTVTISRNLDGTGAADVIETIAVQADGGTVDTTTARNAAGSTISQLIKTTSANGLSSTQTLDANGDGKIDETQTDAIVINADGSKTETYSDANANANIQPQSQGDDDTVVTTTSADGLSKTIVVTGTNEGFSIAHSVSDITTLGVDGSSVETRTITAKDSDGTYTLSKEVITNAAHGLSRTVQLDEYGSSAFDVTDKTVLNSDGSTTETYTELDDQGALFDKDVTTTSANGRNITVQRDTDGDGNFDQFKSTSLNVDGSRTDAIWTTLSDGVTLADKTVETNSPDGRSHIIQYDFNGDGSIDGTETQVSVINSDGSKTETRRDLNANGSLRDQIVTITSANGLSITGTTDLDGNGTVDERYANSTVLNADGTKTATVQTNYSDGSLKSKTVTVTSANGLTITTNEDLNGDGKTDVSEVDVTDDGGSKTSTISYYNASGVLASRDIATVSADGRLQSISRDFDGDGKQDVLEEEDHVANQNGSYDAAAEDAYGGLYEGNHTIDENGVDEVVMFGADGTPYDLYETTQQESTNYGYLNRLYDAMLDRDPTSSEKQSYFQYENFKSMISAVTAGSEFTQKYGAVTNSEFVEQIYENALVRGATLAELSGWLSKLKSAAVTKADFVLQVAENAQHLTVGDTHAVTNNSQSSNGKLMLDHTTDKLVAAGTVDRIIETVLNRHKTSAESTSWSAKILNGTATEAQIAAAFVASSEFKTDYGTLTDAQFVTQMFMNGLNRPPTSSELSTWSGILGAKTISREDFVAGIADSPDFLSANGTASASMTAMTTSAASSASANDNASLNRMVQAMSTMTAGPASASSTPFASVATSPEHQLAVAHH